MKRCRHDVKIEVLLKLFEPMTKKIIAEKAKLKSKKLNKILEDFKEKKLIQELKEKDGTILYRTTPKGRKLVKIFKDIMDHLEGKEVLPHIFDSYR
jgi:predicted transcriptional regulator